MSKNKKFAIGVVAVLVFFVGLAIISRPGPDGNLNGAAAVNQNSNSGDLKASEEFFDFGIISMAAGKVSRVVKLKNTGDSPLTLTKVYTSCMCTSASLMRGESRIGTFGMPGHGLGSVPSIKEKLESGEEANLEVIFDPAAHGPAGVGKIARSVFVEQEDKSPVEIKFQATVTP